MASASPAAIVAPRHAMSARRNAFRYGSALLASFTTHGILLGVFAALVKAGPSGPPPTLFEQSETRVETVREDVADPHTPFSHADFVGPDDLGRPNSERVAELDIPTETNPKADVGVAFGELLRPRIASELAAGALPKSVDAGSQSGFSSGADVGGPMIGMNGAGVVSRADWHKFLSRGNSGGVREQLGLSGKGADEANVAVTLGLKWLVRQQSPDGRWRLDGAFQDKGSANDVAGTALGLLPFLAVGKTHRPTNDNPYEKVVEKALAFLIRRQNSKTGELPGGMYAHGLATIALCETFGLTQDPLIGRHAQKALHFITNAQHDAGGWRYGPKQPGDLSVTGWQIMALKSGMMAGLTVPDSTVQRAIRFLDSCRDSESEGYGYVNTSAAPTTSAIGLLCRQYLQAWGPGNPKIIKGIDRHLRPVAPGGKKDAYFYYYAAQVFYHFGGESWKPWYEKVRKGLVDNQVRETDSANLGSWSSTGDPWAQSGGRLYVTSLNLLTLGVQYRHLPLYFRQAAMPKPPAP